MAELPSWPYPRLIAHRGAGTLAPENTLAAMRLGHAHGYRMVEFDVKLAADGVAFLFHDATLDRTTNSRGRADALVWGQLAQLDAGAWHSPGYAGESIPTLAAVAAFAQANDLACNIEIKPVPGRERETGSAVALDARVLWRDAVAAPLLSSFSEIALEAARTAAPELPRALLFDVVADDWLVRLQRLDCVALDANQKNLHADLVRAVRDAGYRVLCYTANEPKRIRELLAWGTDSIITDAIDRIAPDFV